MCCTEGGIKAMACKNSNYQQLESQASCFCVYYCWVCRLFFLPRCLSLSDRTVSRGEPTSDCYLCVIRRCTAEPNNTLPLIRPTVRAPPSWLYLIYEHFVRCSFRHRALAWKELRETRFFAASAAVIQMARIWPHTVNVRWAAGTALQRCPPSLNSPLWSRSKF